MKSRPVRIVHPYSFKHSFSVKAEDDGLSLLHVFTLRFPFKSQFDWEYRIRLGHIRINDKHVNPESRVKKGDRISHLTENVIEPSVPDEIQIIEDQNDWLAVFKPAPLPMHSGGRYHKNTLQFILEKQLGHPVFVTHRLDAVTSGIILLAKNERSAKAITQAFVEKAVHKEYKALVSGIPEQTQWSIDKPIRRKEGFIFECCESDEGGKHALTEFTCTQKQEEKGVSTIQCNPQTGRTHQLRLHLVESGLPIIDDFVYHPKQDSTTSLLQNRAIHLCHTRLEIPSMQLKLTCELPNWWGEIG